MTQIDDILTRELGKVGKLGGQIGGSVVGAGRAAGKGGSFGARFAARFLPTGTYDEAVTLAAPPKEALGRVIAWLEQSGSLLNEGEMPASARPMVAGVVGSGYANMNPTIVQAEITAITDASCTLLLKGSAKEGLIKQHSAEKAIKRLLDYLAQSAT